MDKWYSMQRRFVIGKETSSRYYKSYKADSNYKYMNIKCEKSLNRSSNKRSFYKITKQMFFIA